MMNRSIFAAVLVSSCTAASVAVSVAVAEPAAPVASASAPAGALVFDFADMKRVNGIAFSADSMLEPIVGFAGGVSGTIHWDPARPDGVTGELSVPTNKLVTPNDGMTKTLHNNEWLDAEKNPSITVKIKSVKGSKPGAMAGSVDLDAVVDLTLAGVTKELEITVSASYLPGRLGDRMRGAKGDLLILRSNFSVNRSDFGIKAGEALEVVSEKVDIRAAIVGARKE